MTGTEMLTAIVIGVLFALPFGAIGGYLILCAEARLRKVKAK